MAKTETIGSWFPSGYHGHYRNQSRNDFLCEYRQVSKPQPPRKFIKRARESSAKHIFSKHDNRHSFMNDALYFEEGMGRKRLPNETNRYRPEFLAWSSTTDMNSADANWSCYKVDYRGSRPMQNMITRRPKTSFDDHQQVTTSYRYSHGNGNPNKESISAMSNTGLTTTPNRIRKGSHISGRESVASCLSWYVPHPPKASNPAATQTTATQMSQTAPAALETNSQSVSKTTSQPPPPRPSDITAAL